MTIEEASLVVDVEVGGLEARILLEELERTLPSILYERVSGIRRR